MSLNDIDLVFVGIATTGPDPNVHEIIDVAVVTHTQIWHTKVAPNHPDRFTPDHLQKHGYSADAWKGALSQEQAAEQLLERLAGEHAPGIVAHGVDPYLRLLRALMHRTKRDGFDPRLTVCTRSLAYSLLVPRGLQDLSLTGTARFLGADGPKTHDAVDEAIACRDVHTRMLLGVADSQLGRAVEHGTRLAQHLLKVRTNPLDRGTSCLACKRVLDGSGTSHADDCAYANFVAWREGLHL